MKTVQRLMALALFFLSFTALCETSTLVHSLDQIPSAFKSKEGLAKFQEQINGDTLPDGFGTTLPAGLSAKTIVELVAPRENASSAWLVGVKPWSYRPNSFIAIVIFSVDTVYLAMLEYQENKIPAKVIANYGKPLDIAGNTVNWDNIDLGDENLPNSDDMTYYRFDFAPFKISENQTAFGIRVNWSNSYAGGGADFQALMLFVAKGDRIINILLEPIYYFSDIAGNWHDDGTRDHNLSEGENIVIMLPHKTNGYYDLQLKTVGSKQKQVFFWSDEKKRYLPSGLKP